MCPTRARGANDVVTADNSNVGMLRIRWVVGLTKARACCLKDGTMPRAVIFQAIGVARRIGGCSVAIVVAAHVGSKLNW